MSSLARGIHRSDALPVFPRLLPAQPPVPRPRLGRVISRANARNAINPMWKRKMLSKGLPLGTNSPTGLFQSWNTGHSVIPRLSLSADQQGIRQLDRRKHRHQQFESLRTGLECHPQKLQATAATDRRLSGSSPDGREDPPTAGPTCQSEGITRFVARQVLDLGAHGCRCRETLAKTRRGSPLIASAASADAWVGDSARWPTGCVGLPRIQIMGECWGHPPA